jgi:hypothetical protein
MAAATSQPNCQLIGNVIERKKKQWPAENEMKVSKYQ